MRVKFLEDVTLAGKEYFRGMQYEAELISETVLNGLVTDGKARLIENAVTAENLVAAKEYLEETEGKKAKKK